MNDRFKFRAWNKLSNEMKDVISLNINYEFSDCSNVILETNTFDNIKTHNNPITCANGLNNVVLMQCTGLKDSNGKLIFEGDVVKVGKWDLASRDSFREDEYIEKIGVINYYQPYCRFLVNYSINAEAFEVDLSECCLGILGNCNVEVIGNIYENKELLDERN